MQKFRISITGLMTLIAVVGVDLAVLRGVSPEMTGWARPGIIGSLPMANILLIYLVIVVSRLKNRGEVALSGVAFLVVGGAALLVPIYTSILAPWSFHGYLRLTTGKLHDLFSLVEKTTFGQGQPGRLLLGLLEIWLSHTAVTATLLVPPLVAAWANRGSRLRLLKGSGAGVENESLPGD